MALYDWLAFYQREYQAVGRCLFMFYSPYEYTGELISEELFDIRSANRTVL